MQVPHDSPSSRCDVLVVGGGVIGSSVAYFVRTLEPGATVQVIEPDPTYALASTPRASGGCRVLFSCPENIEMSLYSIEFIRRFAQAMKVGEREAPVDWVEGGYLFIVPPAGMGLLEANYERQRAHGCVVQMLEPDALKARFPSMRVDDLGGGVHSPRDGWCDPNSLLQGFRRKAIDVGATYRADRVVGLRVSNRAVRQVALERGGTVHARHVVIAAGAWSGEVARMAGVALPVSPLRRFEHYFTPGTPMERLPYVKDLDRLAFRSEGAGFSGGLVDGDEPRGFNFDVDHGWFERAVWPALAHRFPPLEAARCHRTWAGLYEQCELDGNPIIGACEGAVDNLYACTGFSGHGMMHAPAAGRGIAELIAHGGFRTIDLSRLGYARVLRDEPYPEAGIV